MTRADAQSPADAAAEPAASSPLRRHAPIAAVCAVLAAALALAHGEVFRAGAAQVVALAPSGSESSRHPLRSADVTFEAWLVARHARTLLHAPWRLFGTPHCAPDSRTLTLGVPAIALGVLGIPAALWSREPLISHHPPGPVGSGSTRATRARASDPTRRCDDSRRSTR